MPRSVHCSRSNDMRRAVFGLRPATRADHTPRRLRYLPNIIASMEIVDGKSREIDTLAGVRPRKFHLAIDDLRAGRPESASRMSRPRTGAKLPRCNPVQPIASFFAPFLRCIHLNRDSFVNATVPRAARPGRNLSATCFRIGAVGEHDILLACRPGPNRPIFQSVPFSSVPRLINRCPRNAADKGQPAPIRQGALWPPPRRL